ncbi:hypothetical protein EV182_004540 [Spiromyces aspiralis]|uniref:Uncharacterized protein n=1 Tax=Spiromyces aspiralis TaxID=68401 RepID=A0ACC1HR26_9FUNG|nr:hypothetical protein EV182_004540 [Spiromyces aspiralis]
MDLFNRIDEKLGHGLRKYTGNEDGGNPQFFQDAHEEASNYTNNYQQLDQNQARGFFDRIKYTNPDDVPEHEHKAHFSHEAIGAAAAWQAMKAFQGHQEHNGNEVDHKTAKKAFASLAVGFGVKLIEEKGIPFIEKKRAAAHASAAAQRLYDQQYGDN